MSNVAVLRPAATSAASYLGPAEVTDAHPRDVDARLPDGTEIGARLALAVPYEPRTGDSVLVIGNGEAHYVIGVLHGTGRTVLELPGDVDLRAVGGELTLSSDKAVRIRAPEVETLTGALRTVADTAIERLGSLRQRVSELLAVHAGQIHTVADGATHAQSKSATILTEEKVTINGKAIHLG